MAVIKIFPQQDATIYTEFPTQNTGISEILDLTKGPSLNYPSYSSAARVLVKFADSDISGSISKYIGSSPFAATLKLYLTDAGSIPLLYDLEAYAISGSWDMGTGRIDNIPITTNGVSWQNRTASPVNMWSSGSFTAGVTSSFFSGNPGGGNWYVSTRTTQSFDNRSDLDVHIDVSSIINQYASHSLINDGIIVKNDTLVEFDPNYAYSLHYFSIDTNTIYPPSLDLKWDDSVYTPNTGSMSQISSPNMVVSLGNNRGIYQKDNIVRFNVNVRDQYPQRSFVTSSIFTVNKYLPSSSYYCVRDIDTNNIIFDFDNNYTKISTDQNGSYFNLYMNGFEPERYYKLQIKTIIGGNTLVFDDNYYFKVNK